MLKIPITGLGAVSCAGLGLKPLSEKIFSSSHLPLASDAKSLPILRVPMDWAARKSFLVAQDLPENIFEPNLLALIAVEEALTQCQFSKKQLQNLRVGICLGSTVGSTNYQERFAQDYFTSVLPDPSPFFDCYHNNTSQFISRHYGLSGPTLLINNACTSGADSIGIGAQWIRRDLCDVVICGGVETILDRMYYGFNSLLLCSKSQCRPFDKHRDGLVLGEAAGIVVLEKPDTTHDTQAFLVGYGSGTDAYHPTAPHPEARGLKLALTNLRQNWPGLPERFDFINAHGTGTQQNDFVEGVFIKEFFSEATLTATKGYTGHTLGASGAIETVITILCLQKRLLPATQGFAEVDPEVNLTPNQNLRSADLRTGISLSLGFGGSNSILCVAAFDEN